MPGKYPLLAWYRYTLSLAIVNEKGCDDRDLCKNINVNINETYPVQSSILFAVKWLVYTDFSTRILSESTWVCFCIKPSVIKMFFDTGWPVTVKAIYSVCCIFVSGIIVALFFQVHTLINSLFMCVPLCASTVGLLHQTLKGHFVQVSVYTNSAGFRRNLLLMDAPDGQSCLRCVTFGGPPPALKHPSAMFTSTSLSFTL